MTSFPASGTGQIDKIKNHNTLMNSQRAHFASFFISWWSQSSLQPLFIILDVIL